MKKLFFALLLVPFITLAQTSQEKVWDLLLKNKREDARKLFDKELKKKKDSDVDLYVLDAIIDQELGQLLFDDSFVKGFVKFPESKYYLYPLWYRPFVVGNVKAEGFDEYSYKKMDFLASQPQYENDIHLVYLKSLFDRRRRNDAGANDMVAKIAPITKWQYCGVFENLNGSGLETDYEPEYYAKNDKTFNANSNGIINWYNPAVPQTGAVHYYFNENEYGNGIIYAQTFIKSSEDKTVVLHFSAAGPLKIFVNDTEIYANDKISDCDINAYQLQFNLKKGINRLMLKSSLDGSGDYFFASLRDAKQLPVTGVEYYDTYMPYNKNTLAELAPQELALEFENYFEEKLKKQPNNPLYALLLFSAYSNNGKDEKSYQAIEKLSEKYPASSLINTNLSQYYSHLGDNNRQEEIKKNMMLADEGYYVSVITKFADGDFAKDSNLSELEKYKQKALQLKSSYFALLFDYIIALRNSDIDLSFKKLDEFMAATHNNEMYKLLFSGLYASFKNDKDKTVSILQDLVKDREYMEAENMLVSYLNSMNRKDEVKHIVEERIKKYPGYNTYYSDAITLVNNDNQYQKAVDYADLALKNFPYSFRNMEKKGKAYNSLKNTKEAEKLFRQALTYNSGDTELRKTLYDITKVPDEIEQVATKDIYQLIKQRRNSKLSSDYGVNLLLDEYIVHILPEGGRKMKTTLVYEVIAESGVEEMKEYNLGNYTNLIKSEIVKPDGSLAPGEDNGGTIVFTNLKVGDVIYVQYESTSNNYGRFYKDFNFGYHFNGNYPCLESIFGIIYPQQQQFATKQSNINIVPKSKKIGNNNYIVWEQKNIPALPLHEDYSPSYYDTVGKIFVSSIKSWSDISNWYADLVKKNMKLENEALKAYNKIFPNGTTGLTEDQIAYTIYKFIEETVTYSSLDFRQSGYVPQKPAKTVSTKLGDCKDVSTLFVAMATKAGLKANLVLVSTNDNGIKSPLLPAIDFNHCIVKVMLNGKEQFLELTDRYLPYKALPNSLYKANALVISFDKAENEKNELINVPFTNALNTVTSTACTINIDDAAKKFDVVSTVSGSNKAYYNELFSEATTADVRKKDLEKNIADNLGKVIVLEDNKVVENDRFQPQIKYAVKFSVSEKLQSVGSLKIFEVPYLDKVYTRNIITADKRNFDINYVNYENANRYVTEVTINLPEGKKFIEVPKNHTLNFKGHNYNLTYETVKPGTLKVTRTVDVTWDNVSTTEYPLFKKYVEEVLAAEEEIVGFK